MRGFVLKLTRVFRILLSLTTGNTVNLINKWPRARSERKKIEITEGRKIHLAKTMLHEMNCVGARLPQRACVAESTLTTSNRQPVLIAIQ